MVYPYYAPYNYPTYQPTRIDQQQYIPQNGPQNAAQSVLPQGNINQTQVQTGFLCRPVTSKEEALAVQVDYLSAGTIMPDLGHGMMYLKRFDSNTGLSNMFEFALVQPQSNENPQEQTSVAIPDYSDTFRIFGEKLGSVSDRIDELAWKLDQLKAKQPIQKGASKE